MPDFPWQAPLDQETRDLIISLGIWDPNKRPVDAEKATPFQKILNEDCKFQAVEDYRLYLATYATRYLNTVPGADSDEGNGHVAFLARGAVDGKLDDAQLFDLDILLKRRALWGKFAEAMITYMGWDRVWGNEKGSPMWPKETYELGWKGYSFQRFDTWDAEQFKRQIREDGQKSETGENLPWKRFQNIRARLLQEDMFATVMVTHSDMAKKDVWAKPIDWLAAAVFLNGQLEHHTVEMIGWYAWSRRSYLKTNKLILPHIVPGSRGATITGAHVIVASDCVRTPQDYTDTSWLTKALMPDINRPIPWYKPEGMYKPDPTPATQP